MIIKSITPGDLRHMHDQEALILQGCGGDLTEWVEGINGILTEEEILKDGFRFEEAYTFKNEGLTCLMIRHFTDVNTCTANDLRATFHGYDSETVTPTHIDYCFIDSAVKPVNQVIITDTVDGKYPSDHFGLHIQLEL